MIDVGTYNIEDGGLVSVDFSAAENARAGTSSLIHRILYHLLSDPGSNKFFKSEGGGLATRLLGNGVMTEDEAMIEASIALGKARSTLLLEYPNSDPDSVITDLSLISVTIDDKGKFSVSIKITTLSGQETSFGLKI